MKLLQAWIEKVEANHMDTANCTKCKDTSVKGWPYPMTREFRREEAYEYTAVDHSAELAY